MPDGQPGQSRSRPSAPDDADHIATAHDGGTLCGAPVTGRNVVPYEAGRTVNPADGCWMCIANFRAEVGW